MITEVKHFHSDIFIPNLQGCINQQPTLIINMARFERKALIEAMGGCLADEFLEQFEFDDETGNYQLKANADEKWHWLLFGKTYEFDDDCGCIVSNCCCGNNCKKHIYKGILEEYQIDKSTDFEVNHLAYFIYYHFQTINESVTAGSGEQVVIAQNAEQVYNKKKRYNAWNRWGDWVDSLAMFLRHHKEYFPTANISCGVMRLNIYDI